MNWVRSLFHSAAVCGKLIYFKKWVCRTQEEEHQPAETLRALEREYRPNHHFGSGSFCHLDVVNCTCAFAGLSCQNVCPCFPAHCFLHCCKYQDVRPQPRVLSSLLSHVIKQDNFHHSSRSSVPLPPAPSLPHQHWATNWLLPADGLHF